MNYMVSASASLSIDKIQQYFLDSFNLDKKHIIKIYRSIVLRSIDSNQLQLAIIAITNDFVYTFVKELQFMFSEKDSEVRRIIDDNNCPLGMYWSHSVKHIINNNFYLFYVVNNDLGMGELQKFKELYFTEYISFNISSDQGYYKLLFDIEYKEEVNEIYDYFEKHYPNQHIVSR